MDISGQRIKLLLEALLSAYPTRALLSEMVCVQLDTNLATINDGGNLCEASFALLCWAASQGRIGELVQKAHEYNQGNPELAVIAVEYADVNEVTSDNFLLAQELSGTHDVASDIFSLSKMLSNAHIEGDVIIVQIGDYSEKIIIGKDIWVDLDSEPEPRYIAPSIDISKVAQTPGNEILGREDLIDRIHNFVAASTLDRYTFLTLMGDSGSGKTATIAVYLQSDRVPQEFDIRWIDCSHSLLTWENLAKEVPESFGERSDSIIDLREYLMNKKALLVFDGVDTEGSPGLKNLLKFMQPSMATRVVLTTQHRTDWYGELAVEVLPLEETDSYRLFLNTLGRSASSMSHAELQAINDILAVTSGNPYDIIDTAQDAINLGVVKVAQDIDLFLPSRDQLKIKERLRQLSPSARDLTERLALLSNRFSDADIRHMAFIPPQIENRSESEREVISRRLWSYDSSTGIYHIHDSTKTVISNDVLGSSNPNLQMLLIAAGNRLLERQDSTQSDYLVALEYLFKANQWCDVLAQAEARFFVKENAAVFSLDDGDILEARACWAMAEIYHKHGRSELAVKYAGYGDEQLVGDGSLKAKALLLRLLSILALHYANLGYNSIYRGYYDRAEAMIGTLSEADSGKLKYEIAIIWLLIGWHETQHGGNNLQRAQQVTHNAITVFSDLGEQDYRLKALSNLATIKYELGLWTESLSLSQEVLANKANAEDSYVIAVEYNNVVDSYISAEQFSTASAYAEAGIEYCSKHGELKPYIMLVLNAALIDFSERSLEKLQARVEKARPFYRMFEPQSLYEALYTAVSAKVELLEALQTESLAQREQHMIEYSRYHDRILNLSGIASDSETQRVLRELEASADQIRREFDNYPLNN